jgi:hypothetical protein
MNSKANGSIKKAGRGDHLHGGPNWVLVAGGILLSTLSVRLGCRLKQLFETKQQNPSTKGLGLSIWSVTCITFPCALKCFAAECLSADYAKLQPKEDLRYVNCTPTSTGSVTKPAAIVTCQVIFCTFSMFCCLYPAHQNLAPVHSVNVLHLTLN